MCRWASETHLTCERIRSSERQGLALAGGSLVPFSVLDLAPIPKDSTPADALHNSLQLAQLAERLGYTRYWLAEHHNMPAIASAATSLVIGYIAGGTKTIRVR